MAVAIADRQTRQQRQHQMFHVFSLTLKGKRRRGGADLRAGEAILTEPGRSHVVVYGPPAVYEPSRRIEKRTYRLACVFPDDTSNVRR